MVKSTSKKQDIKRLPLPDEIKKHHLEVELTFDIFYVNRIPFLLYRSTKLTHMYTCKLKSRRKNELTKRMSYIKSKYIRRG